ncbi:AAA family ATPase [Sodaliphilus pleomorphus]|uniref:AAA family ATPase n=1 Tax=Sodaliphilus pleomorphus TaxID=2606626 RepID=UPI002409FB77|nr:AAA family ATPase [Sodaliphilus pleomorphus]MDD6686828.1 AAA family ATPase [Sodaliphilus pleomorphus]
MSSTLGKLPSSNDDELGDVLAQMGQEYPLPEYPLRPIVAPSSGDTVIPSTDETVIAEATARSGDNGGFDFSRTDNPEKNPNVGLFTVKSANQVIDEAKNRPIPCKLFGQLWFEGEVEIMFADTNLGKSILAVQIADAISSGKRALEMEMNAKPQMVLYCDFELSDKQFENRYRGDDGSHYSFSPDLMHVEINPDVVDYPDGCDFEDYVKLSLEQIVLERGAKVIIIDNLTYLSRETEKAKDALPLMKWLKSFARKYGLSILVLAHTPKRNLSNPITRNDLQGSKMLINFCDGCFAIGESTKDKSIRYIKEIKQRNEPIRYDAENVIVCEIIKPDNFLHFSFLEWGCESEHLRQMTATDRDDLIEQVKELSSQGKSQREISKQLGIGLGSVNKYLKI